jgi:putative redox protein
MSHTTYTVRAFLDEGYKTRLHTSSHVLVADEPTDLGGKDLGPSPYEFILSGLGACTAMTLRMYATRKQWPMESLEVELHHTKGKRSDFPSHAAGGGPDDVIDVFERKIRLFGPLDDEQRARLLDIAGRCPVGRTLAGAAYIDDSLVP